MPYRGDLESQLEAAKSEITSLQNKLSDANRQLKRNTIVKRLTSYGIFILLVFLGIVVFGGLGTFCLCIANDCSTLAALGASLLLIAGTIIIGAVAVGCSWDDVFKICR